MAGTSQVMTWRGDAKRLSRLTGTQNCAAVIMLAIAALAAAAKRQRARDCRLIYSLICRPLEPSNESMDIAEHPQVTYLFAVERKKGRTVPPDMAPGWLISEQLGSMVP